MTTFFCVNQNCFCLNHINVKYTVCDNYNSNSNEYYVGGEVGDGGSNSRGGENAR